MPVGRENWKLNEINDEEIVAFFNCDNNEIENQAPSIGLFRNLHNDRVQVWGTAIKYIERQEEATAIDIKMLRGWQDFVAKKCHSLGY